MRWWILPFIALALGACASDHAGPAAKTPYVSSEYGVDLSPYAYGNPSPYGYALAWGTPDAATGGYVGANRFSPRTGLVCEISRNICYDRNGVDYAETEKYLGSRSDWYRDKRYGSAKIYVVEPLYGTRSSQSTLPLAP